MANDLVTKPAEVSFTLTITRKETGKVETYDMVGHVIPELPPETETKEI